MGGQGEGVPGTAADPVVAVAAHAAIEMHEDTNPQRVEAQLGGGTGWGNHVVKGRRGGFGNRPDGDDVDRADLGRFGASRYLTAQLGLGAEHRGGCWVDQLSRRR